MDTAQINGTSIAFKDSGGSGPVVILSHGFLMDHSMFDSQVSALASKFRVITWDERGFGGTKAMGEFTYWDSAKDVLGLMDHFSIDSAIVGGMSQGGFLSLRVALLAPDRVQALILIDTQAGTEAPETIEPYNQLHSAWIEHGAVAVQDVISSIILGPGSWDQWYAKWAVMHQDQFSAAFNCLMHRDDITSRLGEIKCPALIIHGTDDIAIPMEKAEILRDGLGGKTTLVAIDGAPHAANITHHEPVNAALLQFLQTLN